jgi:hypothetical protein
MPLLSPLFCLASPQPEANSPTSTSQRSTERVSSTPPVVHGSSSSRAAASSGLAALTTLEAVDRRRHDVLEQEVLSDRAFVLATSDVEQSLLMDVS